MNLLRPIDRNVTVQGLRFHVLDWGGEGRTPLLLLHGFTGHAHAWDTLAIALQPHFHVYALDQRGHGDSDPAEVYGPIAAFDDLSGVIDQLGLAPLVVVGLSMGGRNAMYFTSKRPESVRQLVIVDIGPEISARASQAPAGPARARILGQHRAGGPAPAPRQPVSRHPLLPLGGGPEPPAAAGRAHRVGLAPEREDAALDGGGGLVGGAAGDPGADPGAARRGEPDPRSRRGGADGKELPQGRFVEIPRAVHTLHEDNPDAVLAALKPFLGF